MSQLREFAQHNVEFSSLNTRIVALSVDDVKQAHQVWEEAAKRQFPILSDPGAHVVRSYGLLHEAGARGQDIAIRTTLLLDENGREMWRRVSETVPDVPSVNEILSRLRAANAAEEHNGADRSH